MSGKLKRSKKRMTCLDKSQIVFIGCKASSHRPHLEYALYLHTLNNCGWLISLTSMLIRIYTCDEYPQVYILIPVQFFLLGYSTNLSSIFSCRILRPLFHLAAVVIFSSPLVVMMELWPRWYTYCFGNHLHQFITRILRRKGWVVYHMQG